MRKLVEAIGEHPFVTGILAILGFGGFILSVVGYSEDREEAQETTAQIDAGLATTNDRIDTGLSETQEQIGSGLDETNERIDDTANAIRSVDETLKQQGRGHEGSYQDGTFLFEDPVEGVYSNFWTAYLNRSSPSPELTIRGEGKTVEFSGTVVLNCDNYKYSWNSGANFYEPLTDQEIRTLVPQPAMRAATRIFCWDRR